MSVPTTADKFKTWADAECAGDKGNWPAELQAQAYRAWQALLKGDASLRDQFEKDLEAWTRAK